MTYTVLPDEFNDDPTRLRLTRGERYLDIEATVWCNKHETDGLIPMYVVRRITDEPDVDTAVSHLVGVGLWTAVGDESYQLPGWHKDERGKGKHQRTSAELKRKRDGNAFIVGRRRKHEARDHSWCSKGSKFCPEGALSSDDAAGYARGDAVPPDPDLSSPDPDNRGRGRETGTPASAVVVPLALTPTARRPRLTIHEVKP